MVAPNKNIVAKMLCYDKKDPAKLKSLIVTFTDNTFDIYLENEKIANYQSIVDITNFLINKMIAGFYITFIINATLANLVYQHKATLDYAVLQADSGAMLFLSTLFKEEDVDLIEKLLNKNVDELGSPDLIKDLGISFSIKIDGDDDDEDFMYKGIMN